MGFGESGGGPALGSALGITIMVTGGGDSGRGDSSLLSSSMSSSLSESSSSLLESVRKKGLQLKTWIREEQTSHDEGIVANALST